ncbi:hypothetical protein GE21DRAFT_1038982 [Neurospora crassa]|nr:hypothetical protein GE21DRAFT_1038982 [Neurospora crassa]
MHRLKPMRLIAPPNLYHYQPHPLAEGASPCLFPLYISSLGRSGSGCCGALCLVVVVVVVHLIVFFFCVCMYTRGRGDRSQKNTRNGFVLLEGAKVKAKARIIHSVKVAHMVKVSGGRKGKEKKRAELL